jgi:DNA adenine methylase
MTQIMTRGVLRYHGGKVKLAPWIISHFPAHKIYIEPFCGAAAVLLQKPRSYAECINDLDGEIVNLFRVLRNPAQARELARLITLTPFAREEFELSYLADGDPVEQARRTVARSIMGFGSVGASGGATGFRNNCTSSGTTPAHDWASYPKIIPAVVGRLRGVVIENRPAVELIERLDDPAALFYVDPPYPAQTRTHYGAYRFEMTDDDHRELAAVLHEVKGAVVLSGYGCELYDRELYADWRRVERKTHADRAGDRVEVLWLNERAAARQQQTLF